MGNECSNHLAQELPTAESADNIKARGCEGERETCGNSASWSGARFRLSTVSICVFEIQTHCMVGSDLYSQIIDVDHRLYFWSRNIMRHAPTKHCARCFSELRSWTILEDNDPAGCRSKSWVEGERRDRGKRFGNPQAFSSTRSV